MGCRIEELLSRTQHGLLFHATRDGKTLALKVYHPCHLRAESPRQRFLRAIDVARHLRHPNLVELLDGGFSDEVPYTISEFVEGEPATEVIQRIGVAGMLDWRRTFTIATDLLNALEFLEANGVLHRNINPRHILIRNSDGCAKLNDLMLSKALDDSFADVTRAGDIVGELPFMSPEQMGSGQPVDHRSDLYQCGATFYALLTGRPPFEASQAAKLMEMATNDPPIPPTRFHLAIPAMFEGIVLTMLAKRPQDRHQSAAEVLKELERAGRLIRP